MGKRSSVRLRQNAFSHRSSISIRRSSQSVNLLVSLLGSRVEVKLPGPGNSPVKSRLHGAIIVGDLPARLLPPCDTIGLPSELEEMVRNRGATSLPTCPCRRRGGVQRILLWIDPFAHPSPPHGAWFSLRVRSSVGVVRRQTMW